VALDLAEDGQRQAYLAKTIDSNEAWVQRGQQVRNAVVVTALRPLRSEAKDIHFSRLANL
jgi:hypothetical protein